MLELSLAPTLLRGIRSFKIEQIGGVHAKKENKIRQAVVRGIVFTAVLRRAVPAARQSQDCAVPYFSVPAWVRGNRK